MLLICFCQAHLREDCTRVFMLRLIFKYSTEYKQIAIYINFLVVLLFDIRIEFIKIGKVL